MAEHAGGRERFSGLLVWCLASFHTAALVLLLVTGLHVSGTLGPVLAEAGTWGGIAAYGYLWAVTWWTNRRWIASVPSLTDRAARRRIVRGGAIWGGLTGVVFFAGVLVPGAAIFAAAGGLPSVPFILLAGLLGGALSALVGAVIGGAFAGLDLVLVGAAVRLLQPRARSTSSGT